MAVPMYSDEVETMQRQISHEDNVPTGSNIDVDKCVKWITDNNFSRIALQFPDALLGASVDIAEEITEKTGKSTFILADTSYGSCCVDEIAAEHVSADAIIHFGHACLSFTKRFPVLYIFGTTPIDVPKTVSAFKKCFTDVNSLVIIYYEVIYHHAISEIVENLKEYKNLVISELVFPNEECKATVKKNQVKIVRNQRYFILPKTRDLSEYSIFYIGCRNETLMNVMVSLNKCDFFPYNPFDHSVMGDLSTKVRFYKQRSYYIERTRDAKILGILVGTLGVSNYISIIKRLRKLIAAANKKSYVIVIGKRNIAKLANFIEIEVFVNVACLDSTVVDCYGFFQPIITPYDLEIALKLREMGEDYLTDFADLLPDGAHHVPLSEMKIPETDVSLITGKTRILDLNDVSDEVKSELAALVQRDEMAISDIHRQAAGEYLKERSWKGLEQKLGETPVAPIQKGQKGIASVYEDEKPGQS